MLVLVAMPHVALAFDLAELMAMLGQVSESSVAFVETKYVSTLNTPLVRRGTMRFIRPDQLQMRVETPYFERMDIAGGVLTIENRRGIRQIDLDGQPSVAAWVASIRATLKGDAASLSRLFNVALTGQAARWSLSLAPREPGLSGVIQRISIDGTLARLTRIEVDERMGDRTVLVIVPDVDKR
ncbi:MAG: LolA-related protein [Betaproteobacteria bacterium]